MLGLAIACVALSMAQGWDANVLHECSCRCLTAARAGDLQFLQSRAYHLDWFLREQISVCAARGGHLEVLQWLTCRTLLQADGHAERQQQEATWMCSSGHGSRAATWMRILVQPPHAMDTWRH